MLRASGWSLSRLARKYKKDHTTILYHCQKWGVVQFQPPRTIPEMEFEAREVQKRKANPKQVVPHKYDYLLTKDGPINEGKSYKEYLEDAKKQKDGAQWYRLYARSTNFQEEKRAEDNPEGFGMV